MEKLVEDIKELSINTVKATTHIPIKRFDKKYKVSEINEKIVDEYIRSANLLELSKYIFLLKKLRESFGDEIFIIGSASVGYTGELPCYKTDYCPYKMEFNPYDLPQRYLPDTVGHEHYLGWAYLNSRALAKVYKGLVDMWILENEVNVTCETLAFGWRHGPSWCSREFIKELIQVIHKGIKEEDNEVLTTINLHTDFMYHIDLVQKGKWIEGGIEVDLEDFIDYIDVIGFDFYPNYLAVALGQTAASPEKAKIVSERIKTIKDFLSSKNREKPILILETGYPSAPTELGFSEDNQSEYISNIFAEAKDKIHGILLFRLDSTEIEEEFRPPYQRIESYWGLYRANGEKKKAFYTYKNLNKENKNIWCK